MSSNIKNTITNIFLELDDTYEINDTTQLFEEEILDSLTILYLVTELENKFNIQIPLEDVTEKNFKDLKSIERFIILKTADE